MNTGLIIKVSFLLGTIICLPAFFLIDNIIPVQALLKEDQASSNASTSTSICDTSIYDITICDTSIYDITTSNTSNPNTSNPDDTSSDTNIGDVQANSSGDVQANSSGDVQANSSGDVQANSSGDVQANSSGDVASFNNEENQDESSDSNNSGNPEDYDSLGTLVHGVKNGAVDNDEISLNDFQNTGAYQGADEQTQDCIDLAAKIGNNLIDYEIVRCSEDQNFFKNQIANNNKDNGDDDNGDDDDDNNTP